VLWQLVVAVVVAPAVKVWPPTTIATRTIKQHLLRSSTNFVQAFLWTPGWGLSRSTLYCIDWYRLLFVVKAFVLGSPTLL
jgi:hypothetical protein